MKFKSLVPVAMLLMAFMLSACAITNKVDEFNSLISVEQQSKDPTVFVDAPKGFNASCWAGAWYGINMKHDTKYAIWIDTMGKKISMWHGWNDRSNGRGLMNVPVVMDPNGVVSFKRPPHRRTVTLVISPDCNQIKYDIPDSSGMPTTAWLSRVDTSTVSTAPATATSK